MQTDEGSQALPKSVSARRAPGILVYSSLFPNEAEPSAGLFIRERMFRVGRNCPMVVVSPKPWFPLQSALRLVKPGYRPTPARQETQEGIEVHFPRFLAFPGVLRRLDGLSMAICTWWLTRRLIRSKGLRIIDAHFAYPDGYAATRVGRWVDVPVCITLRGTEVPLAETDRRLPMIAALREASHIFSVADALRRHVATLGIDAARVEVVGNGVDVDKFHPVDAEGFRQRLGISSEARVIVSVGGLVERKGFHRVLECLPKLLQRYPDLHYLIIGGASAEGDWEKRLRMQVEELQLNDKVHFLGFLDPDRLRVPLSAADVFVLATRNEGWANVFLEALACGLPVVTTDVGGNREVVCSDELGIVVPFGDGAALTRALEDALGKQWNREFIVNYARQNSWDSRVGRLMARFRSLADGVVC